MVYFIQEDTGDTGFIKIGYTQAGRDAAARAATLQIGNARPLVVRAVLRDHATAMERRLHRHFRELRLMGEWFVAAPRLTEFVSWASQNEYAAARQIELRLQLRPRKRISARQLARRDGVVTPAMRLLAAIDSGAVVEKRLGAKTNQRADRTCPMCSEPIELGEEMLEAQEQEEFVHADCVPAAEYQALVAKEDL